MMPPTPVLVCLLFLSAGLHVGVAVNCTAVSSYDNSMLWQECANYCCDEGISTACCDMNYPLVIGVTIGVIVVVAIICVIVAIKLKWIRCLKEGEDAPDAHRSPPPTPPPQRRIVTPPPKPTNDIRTSKTITITDNQVHPPPPAMNSVNPTYPPPNQYPPPPGGHDPAYPPR